MNPQVPALIQDIKLLASVTGTYADVTPELAATLRNLTRPATRCARRRAP